MKFQQLGVLLVAVASSILSAPTFASIILWDTPGNITADTDVITTGSLVTAINSGNAFPATVNTVLFAAGPNTGLTSTGTLYDSISFGGPGLTANYAALVGSGVYTYTGENPAPPMTLTFNSLIQGDTYKVQVWMNDNVGGAGRLELAYDGVANSATLSDREPATGLGQYVVGTFVADSSHSQVVVFTNGNVVDQVNAYQLRLVSGSVPVPEPSSLILFGLGAIGLFFAAHRRRIA